MKGSIAVTQRVLLEAAYSEPRDALSHDWVAWRDGQALSFVPLPNRLADPASFLKKHRCAALLLSNGNDVGEWAGDAPPPPGAETAPAAWRDLAEFRALEHAVAEGMPVFGVCRGRQMINRFFGGSICRSLRAGGFAEHVKRDHPVQFVAESWRRRLGAESHRVNSWHEQGVRPADLAASLCAVAVSDDGVVEALEHDDYPIRAIQWHPERPPADDPINAAIVRWGLGL